ncbi:(2Fe-2S)-binding protein [Nitratireductor sp. ZSWI3]|uniref:(2Fe-2S)-binding protein n=1 Tax=Nitratireductor sp. ZSWI3 TaxID=2966359 RepID=UPI00214FAB5F|nr:(2Fe-2S)-binding protein [Nitratireductor sp. ZSWI3]MCR4264602.1 (2Fe-2S)-binding protein [Nitratireductor sp. ZSWI3]
MKRATFSWLGRDVPFLEGESIASALDAAGLVSFGPGMVAGDTRYFCGIGACQGCLVRVNGVVREACLAPASAQSLVEPLDHDAGGKPLHTFPHPVAGGTRD